MTTHTTEVTVLPTGCTLDDSESSTFAIKVSYRGYGKYAIIRQGDALNIDGRSWLYERMPSGRSEEFKAEFRHEFDAAVALAEAIVDDMMVMGMTFAQCDVWRNIEDQDERDAFRSNLREVNRAKGEEQRALRAAIEERFAEVPE